TPLLLLVGFAMAGGHIDAPETAVAFWGHLLHSALVATASVAAAAATKTVAQATTLGIALSLTSWAIEASDGFAALAWMGSFDWVSVGKHLGPLEQGIFHLGSLGWLVALTIAAGVIAFTLGEIEAGVRRPLKALLIVFTTLPIAFWLGSVHRGYDWSEQ